MMLADDPLTLFSIEHDANTYPGSGKLISDIIQHSLESSHNSTDDSQVSESLLPPKAASVGMPSTMRIPILWWHLA